MSDAPLLSLLVLRCADIERSRDFYSALGLSFSREQHESGPVHFSSSIGGVVIELYPQEKRNTSDLRFGLRLHGDVAVLVAIVQLGGHVLSQSDDDVPRAVIRDPDGHTIELELERRSRAR